MCYVSGLLTFAKLPFAESSHSGVEAIWYIWNIFKWRIIHKQLVMTYTTGLWLWRWEARWADRADDQDWPLGWRQRGRRAWCQRGRRARGQLPDPSDSLIGPPLPNYCGTCKKTLVENDWQPTELRLIIQGIFRPSVEKDCVRWWHGNDSKEWQEELDNLSSSSDDGSVSKKREPSIWENKANIGLGCPTQRLMFVLQNWHKLEPWSVMIFYYTVVHILF